MSKWAGTDQDVSVKYENPEVRRLAALARLNQRRGLSELPPSGASGPNGIGDRVNDVVREYLIANNLYFGPGRDVDGPEIHKLVCSDLLKIFKEGAVLGFTVEDVTLAPYYPRRPGWSNVIVTGTANP